MCFMVGCRRYRRARSKRQPGYDGGPAPRNFTDHEFHTKHVDAELRQTIINGKGTGMPAFGTTFTSEQLDALVAYVRSLDPGGNK